MGEPCTCTPEMSTSIGKLPALRLNCLENLHRCRLHHDIRATAHAHVAEHVGRGEDEASLEPFVRRAVERKRLGWEARRARVSVARLDDEAKGRAR